MKVFDKNGDQLYYIDNSVIAGGSGGGGHIIMEDGTSLPPRAYLNFTGPGVDVSDVAPQGLIDKRNSGAGSLDYAINVLDLVPGAKSVQEALTSIFGEQK